MNMVQKRWLMIAVNDAYVEKTIEAIVKGARDGAGRRRKIFIVPLEDGVRIRTGERGACAI